MIRSTALLIFLSAFALASAAPSPTPPSDDIYSPGRALVADINRIVTPNGVDEIFEIVLGGARQVVNVRGADRANPILLFVHGGPAAVDADRVGFSATMGGVLHRCSVGSARCGAVIRAQRSQNYRAHAQARALP